MTSGLRIFGVQGLEMRGFLTRLGFVAVEGFSVKTLWLRVKNSGFMVVLQECPGNPLWCSQTVGQAGLVQVLVAVCSRV